MGSIIPSTGLFGSIANIYATIAGNGARSMKPFMGVVPTKGLSPDLVRITPEAQLLFDTTVAINKLQIFTQSMNDTAGPIATLRELTSPGYDHHVEIPEDNVVVFGGDSVANQKYVARDYARIATGIGADSVSVELGGEVFTGEGNDEITGHDAVLVDAGDGDDTVTIGHDGFVHAGAGNDTVVAKDRTQIDGGAGDDTLTAEIGGVITGGTGNDTITVGDGGYAQGDAGDDTITLNGGGRVYLDAGDGADTVTASGDVTFQFGADLTAAKLQVEVVGDDLKLSFGGSESIIYRNYKGASPTLEFADGTVMKMSFGA
jgi:hypothetical protein